VCLSVGFVVVCLDVLFIDDVLDILLGCLILVCLRVFVRGGSGTHDSVGLEAVAFVAGEGIWVKKWKRGEFAFLSAICVSCKPALLLRPKRLR
jgi:hypothetical protein